MFLKEIADSIAAVCSEKKILQIIAGVSIVLVFVSMVTSCTSLNIPAPDAWLVEWTSWLFTVVTTVVAARIFWIGGSGLRELAKIGRLRREKLENEKRPSPPKGADSETG